MKQGIVQSQNNMKLIHNIESKLAIPPPFPPSIHILPFCWLNCRTMTGGIIIPVRIQNKKMQTVFPSEGGSTTVGNYSILWGQLLGKGTTGTVYQALDNLTKISVAAKVIDSATIKDDATRSLLDNEKMALQTIDHGNVVRLKDIIDQEGKCFIITQLCEGQTLREYILRQGRLSEEEAMGIFRKLLAGCLAITQACVIHRDLKPANIMVSPSPALEPKVIDFGFCEVIRAKKVMRTFNVGSPSYMAPEAYLRTLYSEKSDSWSLGMILFEMLTGHTLDEGQNIKEYFESMRSSNFLAPFINGFSEQVRDILEKALKYLPEERISISSMKYAADLYHIRRARQEQASFPTTTTQASLSSTHNSFTNTQGSFRTSRPPPPRPVLPQTLHNISGQTLNCASSRQGFISFVDFSKPPQGRHNKASQISLNSSSNKNSSVQYSMGRTNENFQFPANKLPVEAYQSLSSKDIMDRRPRGPPAFRQVTVRYL